MQFNILALTIAAMATVAVAHDAAEECPAPQTVTVYACPTGATPTAPGTPGGFSGYGNPPAPTGTGGLTGPAPSDYPPITYQGAASNVQVSALGMVVAGAVALMI